MDQSIDRVASAIGLSVRLVSEVVWGEYMVTIIVNGVIIGLELDLNYWRKYFQSDVIRATNDRNTITLSRVEVLAHEDDYNTRTNEYDMNEIPTVYLKRDMDFSQISVYDAPEYDKDQVDLSTWCSASDRLEIDLVYHLYNSRVFLCEVSPFYAWNGQARFNQYDRDVQLRPLTIDEAQSHISVPILSVDTQTYSLVHIELKHNSQQLRLDQFWFEFMCDTALFVHLHDNILTIEPAYDCTYAPIRANGLIDSEYTYFVREMPDKPYGLITIYAANNCITLTVDELERLEMDTCIPLRSAMSYGRFLDKQDANYCIDWSEVPPTCLCASTYRADIGNMIEL